jgi:hypothetical protein
MAKKQQKHGNNSLREIIERHKEQQAARQNENEYEEKSSLGRYMRDAQDAQDNNHRSQDQNQKKSRKS